MKKSNVATVRINDKKYMIESDTAVTLQLANGSVSGRVVGTSNMGDALRIVTEKEGISEVPLKLIKKISEKNKGAFSGITIK